MCDARWRRERRLAGAVMHDDRVGTFAQLPSPSTKPLGGDHGLSAPVVLCESSGQGPASMLRFETREREVTARRA